MQRRHFLQSIPLGASALSAQHPGFAPVQAEAPPLTSRCRYSVVDGAIAIDNGTYFNNRPLYCAHIPAAALGGDRPLLRLIDEHEVCGTFSLAFLRGGAGKWLHDCDSIRMRYRCGHLMWSIADSSWPGLEFLLEAVPFDSLAGFAARLRVTGVRDGDQLLWAFGGVHEQKNVMWAFDPVLMPQDDGWRESLSTVLQRGFEPDKCAGNEASIDNGQLRVTRPGAKSATVVAPPRGAVRIGDAAAFAQPASLLASQPATAPLGFGLVTLAPQPAPLEWTVTHGPGPAAAFDARLAELEQLGRRAAVKTPEPRLDTSVNAALHAVDSIYYPPVFHHGCMAWNVRLPAWRTLYGGTVFGWRERVEAQARFYLATQVKEALLTTADPEPKTRLCEQSSRSRLNGLGRIPLDSGHYDFQSQLFDHLIHAWRWTGSPELERLLREALPLHAVWMRECFDPDNDGLYESYINTWPTDTVWYNGGGSVEESSYAYTVHRALADLSTGAEAATHRETAEKIRRALAAVLWVRDHGHYAAYIEQGGHRRVHEDAWIYSQFLPIDAGISTFEESLQALHYCEWGLENVAPPFGGRRVWSSNWVPSKWSARELYHGDNYHLALVCFQSGLGAQGWEILKGNLLDSAFARIVPGSQSMAGAGTDFADILSPFCRAVVEGLFGYAPDRPNGVVRVRPGWPSDWPEASITTPDFSLNFRREAEADLYELKLHEAAAVEFSIPVRAEQIRGVECNGAAVPWTTEPGSGCTVLRVNVPRGAAFALKIDLVNRLPHVEWQSVTGRVDQPVQLTVPRGEITDVRDLHSVLQASSKSRTAVSARLASKPGHHLVLVKVRVGTLEQWTVFRVRITDASGDARRAARSLHVAPPRARWRSLDLNSIHNGDIRAIFQQQYLSPRPATVSVRLGIDGYSPWTFAPWKLDPPPIDLTQVPRLTARDGRLVTPQGAHFTAPAAGRNTAFTSLWDNWPARVTVPVGHAAEAAWLLVAGSTNPMQTRIANALVKFRYTDGVTEELELVPPFNFWSLCPLGGRDYSYQRDAFCLPKEPPPMVQLGANCRAMVLNWKLRRGVPLESITLEALSQEVIVGLLAASLMNPARPA